MEKLQQALEKAREQRAGQKPAERGAARPDMAAAAEPADLLWQALTPCELDPKRLEKKRIVTTAAGRLSTPFDILRTKVLLAMRKNGWRRLAITSPTANCGKTTTACNLALGFARQADVRVILMELDLRKPSIATNLALSAGPDLAPMLAGEVEFADQARLYRNNVAISAARKAAADPTAVLLSQTTHDTLRRIEDSYAPDLMIFDLPPLLVSDDARAFLKDVDCALMVTRAESSTISQIDACEREIAEQTNVLGVMLNQCRHVDDVHSGYYTDSE